jgi:hypothetical protein
MLSNRMPLCVESFCMADLHETAVLCLQKIAVTECSNHANTGLSKVSSPAGEAPQTDSTSAYAAEGQQLQQEG